MKRFAFEFPEGYKPDACILAKGIHISEMRTGMVFLAPDQRHYKVVEPPKTVRCAGGLREYDLFAICLDEPQDIEPREYVFHSPVDADPAMFTFPGGAKTVPRKPREDKAAAKAVLELIDYCRSGSCKICIFNKMMPGPTCPGTFLLKDISTHQGFVEHADYCSSFLKSFLKEEEK